ncbi:hypothetical protein GCM10023223_32890 [Stackebrandtia albiflava]
MHFQRQPAVRWLSTRVLTSTAARLALARLLGAYLDKRELQALSPQGVFDHSDGDELWLDYVADIGDGFDATYSVAYLASQPELRPSGPPERHGLTTRPTPGPETGLPRGDILVMGGDQVYPAANWRDYENRCKGPYQAALPAGGGWLYAVSGNHDWFDGLTSFLRVFCAERDIGGRTTRQRRSYWAVRLPHRWWLIGIDAQFDAYLDGPQLQYFTEALAEMEPGDPVILCVPRPSWVWTEADPRAYDRIDYFIRMFIKPKGGKVPLILTGDRHHYAHYQEIGGPRHLVTAGGGGAYLSATHTLPEILEAPPHDSMVRHGSPVRTYERGATYPERKRSWSFATGVFWRLPRRNPSFVILLGLIHLLGLMAFVGSPGTAVAAAAATVGATVMFANPSAGGRTARHWIAGLTHGVAHLALVVAGSLAWSALELSGWLAHLGYVPVAGLAATMLVAAYLLVAGGFGVNENELFAGQCIDDAKCFVRLRVTASGVTVYPVAIPKVGRLWKAEPDGPEDASWISPEQPIRSHLIEPPFTIPGKIPGTEKIHEVPETT